MLNSPIDPENLPEPIRNLLQNLDPGVIEQMAGLLNQDTLTAFFQNMLGTLQQSMKPEEAEMLRQLMATLMKSMGNMGK